MVNVSNTKISDNYVAPNGVKQADGTKFTNSVIEKAQGCVNTSVEENQKTSKLDELLEKMCAELKKLSLNPQELKNSGILFRITGMNEQQLQAVSEKELKEIIDCLKAALQKSIVNGKVDIEKAGKLGNDYYVAINTGWTLNGFIKYPNHGKTLFQRLKEECKELVGQYDKVEDVPPEVLAKATIKFFNDLKGYATGNKGQLQTFGILLINTPDKDKAVFKQALAALATENREPGLQAVLKSFDTPEARTQWADSWNVEEIKAAVITVDKEGNTLTEDQATDFVATLTSEKSEEGIKKTHADFQKDAKAFFEENAKVIESIYKKIANNENNFTPEELAVKEQLDKFYTAYASGELAGTAINKVIDKTVKEQLLAEMNQDAGQFENYEEVIKGVTEYIEKCAEKNPEILTMSEEELVKILDKATGGNYTNVINGEPVKLPSDTQGVAEQTTSTPDYGFSSVQTPDTTKRDLLFEQVVLTSDKNPKFTLEKNNKREVATIDKEEAKPNIYSPSFLTNAIASSAKDFEEAIKESNTSVLTAVKFGFTHYSNASNSVRKVLVERFQGFSASVQKYLVPTNSSSAMLDLAQAGYEVTDEDLRKSSTTTRKIIEKYNEKHNVVS